MMTLLDDASRLCASIGPRAAGSDGERAACRWLEGAIVATGATVIPQSFSYRSWANGGQATLRIAGEEPLAGTTWPYTLPSGEDCDGMIVEAGRTPIIRGRLECDRFDLVRSGRAVGRILVTPYDDLRPTPNPSPWDALPTLLVGRTELMRLQAAAAQGSPAVLQTSGSERLATGMNLLVHPGSGAPSIVVVAHYDSVPGSPGANDNAAGIAVWLETIRRTRRDAPVLFVATAAEELMFVGARAAVGQLAADGVLAGLAGCLAIDMIGVGEGLRLRTKEGLWASAGQIVDLELDDYVAASDHAPFHDAGVDAAQLTRLGDAEYHSPRDTSDRLTLALLEEAADAVAALVGAALEVGAPLTV